MAGWRCASACGSSASPCTDLSPSKSKGLQRWETNALRQQALSPGLVSSKVVRVYLQQKCSQEMSSLVWSWLFGGSNEWLLGGWESHQANLPCFTVGQADLCWTFCRQYEQSSEQTAVGMQVNFCKDSGMLDFSYLFIWSVFRHNLCLD